MPTQLQRLLDSPSDLAALQRSHTVLLGGGPIDPTLRARATGAGLRVVATYGSAETAGGCVYDGLPLDGVAVAIDAAGRIRIAGPTLFDEYDGDPELTAETLVDGWFLTADAGRIDEDGRLSVLGRVDDMIVTGGVNVPGPAVAARLREHPDVAAAEVVGVPDEEWGNRVVAFVVGTLSLEAARDWVAEVRPRSWAPRQLVVLDAIPMLGNGKPDRLALRSWPVSEPRSASVWSVPMRTRFRGITVREGDAAAGRGRLGGVEPVPGLRRRGGRAVAALRGGGGRRRLAGAGARPRSRST